MSEPIDDDEKRRKKAALTRVIFILIFLGAIGVFALTVLGAILSGDGRSSDRPAAATTVTVTYRVTGNDRYLADLTYTNASGNVEQFDGAFLPWEMEIKVPVGQAVYISAQSPRAEGIANHAIDSYLDYQQRPAVVLERQLNTVQENSLSNAEGFPVALLLMAIGLGILVFAHYYEYILTAKTEYLKAKKRAEPKAVAPKPIQVMRPLDPWAQFRQPARPPSLPIDSPQASDDDGESW